MFHCRHYNINSVSMSCHCALSANVFPDLDPFLPIWHHAQCTVSVSLSRALVTSPLCIIFLAFIPIKPSVKVFPDPCGWYDQSMVLQTKDTGVWSVLPVLTVFWHGGTDSFVLLLSRFIILMRIKKEWKHSSISCQCYSSLLILIFTAILVSHF